MYDGTPLEYRPNFIAASPQRISWNWLHPILLELRRPLAIDPDSYDDGICCHVIWSVVILVIGQRKPYRWFFKNAIIYWNLARFNYFFLNPGLNFGFGQIFFPVSQALTPCYSVWIANIARECLNINKKSHKLNVIVQFASWNSKRGARGLGSMPSSSTDIQGDLGGEGEWFNCFLSDDTWEHCKHIPEVCRFFTDFDGWWYGVTWCSSPFLLSTRLYEALWGEILTRGPRY